MKELVRCMVETKHIVCAQAAEATAIASVSLQAIDVFV
jgi:hypothetical protein